MPNSCSSGAMKIWKQSSTSASAFASTVPIAASTSVLTTIGRTPSRAWAWLISLIASSIFLGRIDEGDGCLGEFHLIELRQQAVAEHLGGDAGTVGEEKGTASDIHRDR
jgi:hypothetical protein